ARAICLSGEEPERARGLNVDTIWADELACWQRAESTWDLAMLALRAGTNPQALITTTPRRIAVLRRILTEASTVQTTETTFANQAHLPPEFLTQRVFGSRILARWPFHLVLDGLDTIELLLDSGNLLIHPRCARLKDAFRNYCRKRRRGEWLDEPADGHPEEDLIDALRGGIRDALPEVAPPALNLNRVHASRLM
ncbi:MAG: terminase large subunit domain-containing protein, partial [Isosphaerales bacterium]